MFFELMLFAFTILFVWDFFYKKRRNEFYKKSNIEGPIPFPIIGNAFHVLKYKPETMFDFIKMQQLKYGKHFCIWLLHEAFIFTSDPKDFESILSSPKIIAKTKYYDFLESWLGRGLLLSTGSKWHSRRKIITPTFHFKILEQFVEVFDQQSDVMVKRLYEKADGKTVIDMFPVACLTALDIIAETAMGVRVEAQQNPDFPYAKAVKFMAETVPTRFMRINRQFDWLFNITAHNEYQGMKDCITKMHQFTDNVIEERRTALEALERSSVDGTYSTMADDEVFGSKKRMAFLDVLLQSTINDKHLSNQDIREEVDTFMFEGHDTTTSGIAHNCYLIGRHPDVQRKLVEEIRTIIGDDRNKPITMRELQDLKYLECVIKESLRLYPPVPLIGRFADEDFEMNGKLVPANTNIILNFFEASRDSDYFSNPNEFRPERFCAENRDIINPFAYVPFSAGLRNCIGQKYAMLEMKSILSKMLRHFEFLPLGEEVRPVMNIILRSATGMNVGLRPRVH